MATEWQKLVKETMAENKDMAFGDVLKLAKKKYKKTKSSKSSDYKKKSNKTRKNRKH